MSQDLREDKALLHVAEYVPLKSYGEVLRSCPGCQTQCVPGVLA